MSTGTDVLLSVQDLKVHFAVGGGLFGARGAVKAVVAIEKSIQDGPNTGDGMFHLVILVNELL